MIVMGLVVLRNNDVIGLPMCGHVWGDFMFELYDEQN